MAKRFPGLDVITGPNLIECRLADKGAVMAVIFYAEGEHPAGFVGYRVATTLGDSKEFRQRYFGLSQYSASAAERMANELDEQWRAHAVDTIRHRRLNGPRRTSGAGGLVTGLRATIRVERGRKAHYGTYVTPMFVVQQPGYGAGEKRFSIRKLGFDEAFTQAVDCYAKVNRLSADDKAHLLTLKPMPGLFTGPLLTELRSRGASINRAVVAEIVEAG